MTPFELFICIESFEDKEKERSKENGAECCITF